MQTERTLAALLVAIAGASAACGGDDAKASGSGGKSGSGGAATGGSSSGGTGGASTGGAGGNASSGIAAKYPGDQGIANDPDVIFADDFESYADQTELWNRWDNTFQQSETRIATQTANVYAGQQSLEFNLPAQDQELSNAVDKLVSPELDQLYLRWYSKFDANNEIVGSSHNGGAISSHYSGPGVPADGSNKWFTSYEAGRGDTSTAAPGQLNIYIYHPEQRDVYGDHFFPTGLVSPNTSEPYDFGPDFVSQPDVIPELDRWYCYEYMVKANTPGSRDGRITLWLDGQQIADFQNLRLRDVDSLTIDHFNLSYHAKSNPKETKKYYDNVVAAKAYIGPMLAP